MPVTRRYLLDILERTLATYFEVFAGLVIASWADVADLGLLSVAEAAGIAAIPAALAVLKGGLARLRGDKQEASMLTIRVRPQLRPDTSEEG